MKLRPFEIGLIIAFAILALVGLFFLANPPSSDTSETNPYGDTVIIWGTFSKQTFEQTKYEIVKTDKAFQSVEYVEKDPRTFESDFLNAVAQSKAPDLIILPHELLVTLRPLLYPISYETIPVRTFKDSYIDGAEIFMRSDGIYGIPFAVDPLVMYWNRDIFSSAGLSTPPRTWELLISQTTPAIVHKDQKLAITQSAVAFGEYVNVKHAKEILSMLFLQAGTTIVEESGNSYVITLSQNIQNGIPPGEAALSFYTQFVSPSGASYSWNRSQVLDRDQFLAGTLAMYFGPGSELAQIERENPNLNYDIAPVPQGGEATTLRNYGAFYAFAIPRASHDIRSAYTAATTLGSADNSNKLATSFGLAPVYRSTISAGTSDPYRNILYQSALISRGWLDPAPKESGDIFRTMVEDMTSGRSRGKGVLSDVGSKLKLLFK